jgi:ATP-dependent helicase IRC3
MELDEIKEICQDIVNRVIKSKNGAIHRNCQDFLDKFDMGYRRNFEILKKVENILKKNGITFWLGNEKISSLSDFEREDKITFKLNTDVLISDNEKVKNVNAGTIEISQEKSNITLFKHQISAIDKLQTKVIKSNKTPFAGLLVLPTGGGKTLTAAYWLARNFLDKGKKILWIAHRHELLEQAKSAFSLQLAYKDILNTIKSFNYRIVSGIHDKPVNIKEQDDIIFSSKDSLNNGFEYLYKNWIKNLDEVFLVIDEAHHATAKTYRNLIKRISEKIKIFRVLGLTATPFRTEDKEQGLLKKVFTDDIIYKIDLKTLINQGILSEPVFEELITSIDMTEIIGEKEMNNLKYFDIGSIGEATAKTIANNSIRNRIIVDTYLKKKNKYKQTIVFALNQDNAIALNKLFKENGVKSDYIISAVQAYMTGATLTKENKEKISKFKKGETDVLINVNILTEGTDVPKVQSVFLTRPTISPILMTQMIGRGLRGLLAGGTKESYIVSFIDNWHDKVKWVSPEKLIIDDGILFNDDPREYEHHIIRLIAINKIEEFAILNDNIIDEERKKEIEKLDFIDRLPLGFYYFSILNYIDSNEPIDKQCDVLVYNNLQNAYSNFIKKLKVLFERNKLTKREFLNSYEIEIMSNIVEREFFNDCDKYPAYHKEDIENILQYYAQKGLPPKYIELKDREKYDLRRIATEIIDADLRDSEERNLINELWESSELEWKAFFGIENKYYLYHEIDLAKFKIIHNQKDFDKRINLPLDKSELKELEKMSMPEIREVNPKYWKELRDKVFAKHLNKDGFYVSATKKFKSKRKIDFQIDHIIPMSHGGLSNIDNLQLLTRRENILKGSKKTESNNNLALF